jgi:hypothetical protein
MKLTRGLLAGGVALVLALTGCSGQESGTPSAGSNGGSGSGTSLFGNVDELVSAASEQSKNKQSAQMTFDMDVAGQKFSGTGAYRTGADSAMKMSMNMGQAGTLEMILLDRTLYMKANEQLKAALGGAPGKEWIKITPDGTDPMSQAMAPMFEQMEQQIDVSKSLEKIKQAGQITKSEETQLNGQDVKHYWITVDLAKLAASEQNPTAKQALEAQVQQGVKTIEQELWLDSDNLPVQVVSQIPLPAGAGAGGNGKATIGFKGWGEPVDIAAPPADQVATPPGR